MLTRRQRGYALHRVLGATDNEAAILAGYQSPRQAACALRRHPELQVFVAALEGRAASVDDLRRLAADLGVPPSIRVELLQLLREIHDADT